MFQGDKSDEQACNTDAKEKKKRIRWASLSLSKVVRNPCPQEPKKQEKVPENIYIYLVDLDCFSPAQEPALTTKHILQLG